MRGISDQVVWPDPTTMISGLGLGGIEDLGHMICVDLGLAPDYVTVQAWDERGPSPHDDHFGITAGIETDELTVVRHYRFPTSLVRLESLVRAQTDLFHEHADRIVTGGPRPAPDAVTSAQDAADRLLTWFDEHVTLAPTSFNVAPYEREDPGRTSGTGQGVHAFLWHRGAVGQVWADLPFSTASMAECLAALLELLVEENNRRDNDGYDAIGLPDALGCLPFLEDAPEEFPTLFRRQLAACGCEREVELLAEAWASTRWKAVLTDLGPVGAEVFGPGTDEAVAYLSYRALEIVADAYPESLPSWADEHADAEEAVLVEGCAPHLVGARQAPPSASTADDAAPHSRCQNATADAATITERRQDTTTPRAPATLDTPGSVLSRRPALAPLVACALLLLVGAANPAYGYYSFLRFAVCATALILASHAVRSGRLGWCAVALPMVVLYAPARYVLLSHNTWNVVDIAFAALLLWAGVDIPASQPQGVTAAQEAYTPWPWWVIPLSAYAGAILVAVNSSSN